jgi:tetratricopeptide (TPR) repeat protein
MAMHADARGLPLTTESQAAAEHYNTTVARFLEYRLDAGAHLKLAIEADPHFLMAQCLQGYFFMMFNTVAVHPKARRQLEICDAGAARLTPRERLHVAALDCWLRGDTAAACARWDEVLFDHPHDLLALRLQHFAVFWMGQSEALRGRVAQVLEAWDDDVPGFGYVLGMMAFGLEECGQYGLAEEHGRRAVAINPEDLWAVHAVAHVLEMQGRLEDGMAWLDQPEDRWSDRNPFRGHLWWHAALFPLDAGSYDRVLDLYDRSIRTVASDFYLDIQNAASLLLRLEILGVDVGSRWDDLAEHARNHLHDHALAFTDIHHMMSLAGARDFRSAEQLLLSLQEFSNTSSSYAASTMGPVAIPLCRAILALGRGEHDRAVEILLPLRYATHRVGGSFAQRDIFSQILMEAAIRGGRLPLARALLSERLTLKPRSRGSWLKYAHVLGDLGDAEGARRALRRGAVAALA